MKPRFLTLACSLACLLFWAVSACKNPPQASTPPRPNAETRMSSHPRYPADGPHPRTRRGHANLQATPGEFDFYLLNLSWSPEFCVTHATSPECGHGLGFVVHGLWPQDNDGDYQENCSNAPGPANPQQYTDLIPTVSLIDHEWQTHGTCSGLGADAYFAAIRKARTTFYIPTNVGSGSDTTGVPPDDLLVRFARANPSFPPGSLALSCGNNRLTAVELCLTKQLQPEACQNVRSCRASVIRVTPQ